MKCVFCALWSDDVPTHVGWCQTHVIFTGSDESCPSYSQKSDCKCRAESWQWRETHLHCLSTCPSSTAESVNLDWEMTFPQIGFTWLGIRYEVRYAGQWQECLTRAQTIITKVNSDFLYIFISSQTVRRELGDRIRTRRWRMNYK